MTAVPVATEMTRPEVPTVATEVVLLLHVPPAVASVNWDEELAQIVVLPEIAAGAANTVTVLVTHNAPQLFRIVYVMAEVPTATPVSTPESEPIVATATVAELHMPALAISDSCIVDPLHTVAGPVIGPGEDDGALTVT